jgi:VanZ family protein
MFQKALPIAAWIVLIMIALVTLAPLDLRPSLGNDPFYERFGAYAVLGLVFGLSYPRRSLMIACIVIGAAVCLEGLQHLVPDRHGGLLDLIPKVSGGLIGTVISAATTRYLSPYIGRPS